MDPEEAVAAERLTRLIGRAYQLGAMAAPPRSSSRSIIELLRQVHRDPPAPGSEAHLDDLVRAADSDPFALRAAASWALAHGPTDPDTLTAVSLLFQASLRATQPALDDEPPLPP